jgi:tetratricopeptide (TPR) repeat protein
MTPSTRRTLTAGWSVLFCLIFGATSAHSDPFLPKDGGQVLESLRSTAFDPVDHEIRQLRGHLTADPGNLNLACQYARRCIERSRSEADPRYLGRAQAALAPWWDLPAPPVDALVLRATLEQSQHDFTNALADLDLATRLGPRNAQVWLTRATILTVLGDYGAARRACAPLAQLAPGLIAITAAANVTSLNGEAERGCALLRGALEGNPSAGASEKIWALTVLAEAGERLGRVAQAETDFKSALALGRRDPYLLGAYADLLLNQGRAPEAADLLKNENRADGLLLRLALAESALVPRPASFDAHVAALKARFEAGHLRGDFVHQREEARFTLCLLGQPREALRLAQANWRVQHEPADLRVLMETALAAGDLEAAQPALAFLRNTRLEDVELAKMARRLDSK